MATSERTALALARHVIVTSIATARALVADYGVPENRLTICRPGTERSALKPKPPGTAIRLLAVGSLVQRKGHDVLVEALAKLKNLSWQLKIVGDKTRDTVVTRALEALVLRHALGDRITLAGELRDDQVADSYAEADIFVLASRHEGYGMAYAEAMAHGLPVVDADGRPLGLLDIVDLVGLVPSEPATAITGDTADDTLPLPGTAAA